MELLVVPKPLFDSEMNVRGYYFSYQYGNALIVGGMPFRTDGSMHSPLLNLVGKVGLEALTMGNIIFVPITPILIMTELQTTCEPEEYGRIVLLIDSDEKLDEAMIDRLKKFRAMGFKVGFKGVTNATLGNLSGVLPLTDYILAVGDKEKMQKMARTLRPMKHIKIVATGLETAKAHDDMKSIGVHLFDGNFYKIPTSKDSSISPMKINFIQMLNAINSDDFELEDFTKVVRQDASLQIQFMRLVNTSHDFQSEIKSLQQAAAILGQTEIKKWATTAVAASMNSDKPSEITRLSMLRARFCENLAVMFEQGMNKDDLFLTGLFSIIDVALDMPIEQALGMVIIAPRIKDALINETGDIYEVLDFVKIYEMGDWHGVSRIALLRNFKIDQIHTAYVSAVTWYSELIQEGMGQAIEE